MDVMNCFSWLCRAPQTRVKPDLRKRPADAAAAAGAAPAAPATGCSAAQDRWPKPRHSVNFYCQAPQAAQVCLVGDFNHWDPHHDLMTRTPTGTWMISLVLPHGHYRYCFLVDGKAALDPNAVGTAKNEQDEPVSLVAVS